MFAIALRSLASFADVPIQVRLVDANCSYFTQGINSNASIQRIALGPDGNLWFTEYLSNSIGRITPDGVVTEFSAGITVGGGPFAITAGPDGNVWFSEVNANNVARVTPDGTITEFNVGVGPAFYIAGIATGPDGNLWFTDYYGDGIGRISPAGDHVALFTSGITLHAAPYGIVAGRGGNLWFTEYQIGGVGKITPDGIVTEYRGSLPTNAVPTLIAAASDATTWFIYTNNIGGVGEVTSAGDITLYNKNPIPFGPQSIVVDSGDNIWFTGAATDNAVQPQISLMDRAGNADVDDCGTLPFQSAGDLAVGPDGNLWFTSRTAIGRLNIRIFKAGFD